MVNTREYNKKRFSIFESEEKTALELMNKLGQACNEVLDRTDEVEILANDNKNNKVSYNDLHTKYQLTTDGTNANFNGSWQGLNKPTLSQEGAAAQVEKNMADIIEINEQLEHMAKKEEVNNFIDSIKEVTFLDGFESNPYTISGDGQNTNSFTNSTDDFISNKVLIFTSTDNVGNVISINDVDLNNINDYDCEFCIEYKITGSNPLYVYTGFVDENNQVIESSWDYKTLSSTTREIFTFTKHIPLNGKKIRVMYATMSQTSFVLGDIKLKKKGILHLDGDVINKEKTVVTKVVASWGDFTTIASAIAWAESNINDDTIINIDIVENTYNECNLTITKDNINLIARSKNVIINADGTTTPDIPQPNRHGLMSQTTCHHKNLTIIAHATRYALHNDGGQAYNATFENCHFIYKDQDNSYGNPVGIGGLANQFLHFKECTFEIKGNITKSIEYGMIWHNTASNSPKTLIILENCNFINCGYMHIFDCGSNAIDVVNIINCKTNSKNKGLLINATSGSTPYTVEINVNGTDIPMIEHTENRLNHYHLIGYDEKVKGTDITLGYAVAFDYVNIGLSENSVKLCTNKTEFYGVATSDINGYGYVVQKGKCAFVYALANNYVKGDMLKINSLGQFEKTSSTDECVARVTENYNLSSNGLISALI